MIEFLELLPTLLTIIFCGMALIIVAGNRYKPKITALIMIPYMLILIVINAFLFTPQGTDIFERFFIFTVFIPLALLMMLVGKKRGIALATGIVNAYLGFYMMFLFKAIFAPRFENQILIQSIIYLIAFPLVLLYLKFFYKKLQELVEELLPEYLSLLLLYGITMFLEIWLYQLVISQTVESVLRLEIFGLAIFSVYMISITGFYIIIKQYKRKMIEISDNRLFQTQFKYLTEQQKISQEKEASLRILRHDMKHLLLLVSSSIKNNDDEEALKVIDNYISTIDNLTEVRLCKDNIINSLLNFYQQKCSENQIELKLKVTNFEDALDINGFELGILLSNLFDNAVNACLKLEENRKIDFSFLNNNDRVILRIKNTYNKDFKMPEKEIVGEQIHGFGSKSVKLFAKRNNAFIDYKITDETYQVTLLFKENQTKPSK